MKRSLVFVLFAVICLLGFALTVHSADWSQYVSGRDNIRLDGYDGQNGYIVFTDGSGNDKAYLAWSDVWNAIGWCTAAAQDLTTGTLDQSKLAPLD